MYSSAKLVYGPKRDTFLAISFLGLLTSACAGGDPMTGTWTQPDATTTLPSSLGGGPLDIDATLELDGLVETPTFHLTMNLSHVSGLADTVVAEGTYVEDGDDLTLTFTNFVIDPASGNVADVAEDGSQCITLMGFGGTPVCFRTPQTNTYTLGETLNMVLDHQIAGADEVQAVFTLNRSL